MEPILPTSPTPPLPTEPLSPSVTTSQVSQASVTAVRNEPSANRSWIVTAWVLALCLVGLFSICAYQLVLTTKMIGSRTESSEYFVLTSVALLNSGLLRFLAMLIGVAIAAGGLLVSFMTISESVGLSGGAGGTQPIWSAALKTNSPGTIGLIAGCFIVCFAVYFRPEFTASPPDSESAPVQKASKPAKLQDPPPLPTLQKP